MNTSLSIFISVIVIAALIYFLLKQKAGSVSKQRSFKQTSETSTTAQAGNLNTELVQSKWRDIEAMQQSGASGLKNALMEADKLLDFVMIQKGFAGETMADRLKSGGQAFTNLNAVWAAHKLRNQLAHEVEHDVVAPQVKQAITSLGNAIVDLGVRLS